MSTMPSTLKSSSLIAALLVAAIFVFIFVQVVPMVYAAGHENLVDGDLVKRLDHPDVFIVKIKNGKYFKRLILNPNIFDSYGHLSWDNIKIVSQGALDELVDSQLVIEVYPDGTPVTGRVFSLTSEQDADTGIKHHMSMSAEDFTAAGHDWDAIAFINHTEAADTFYPEGGVRTASALSTAQATSDLSVGANDTRLVKDGGTLTVAGDLTIEQDGRLSLGNDSRLSVSGDLTLQDGGTLSCGQGELRLDVGGNLRVDGDIECRREESDLSDGDLGLGVVVVTSGSAVFSGDSEIFSNGHIVIVDDPSLIPTTQQEIDDLYADAASDTGSIPRIGPIVPNPVTNPVRANVVDDGVTFDDLSRMAGGLLGGLFGTESAGDGVRAGTIQDPAPAGPCFDPVTGVWIPDCTEVSGEQWVRRYPPGTKRIVLLRRSRGELRLTNYTLHGPPTPKGADGLNECTSIGEPGPNALRLNGRAPVIRINNFTVDLPHGGDGGNAATPECDDAYAEGGAGGQAGNMKLQASRTFSIEGAFIINPGWGGDGGSATANGKNQTECEKVGGKATAVGGAGADNIKELKIFGTVAGTSNIQVGSMYGGFGGKAVANGGKGGPGCECGKTGAAGGDATATGGKGGDAKVTIGGGAGSTLLAEDVGGDGGDAEAYGGEGGKGGSCPWCTNTGPGGTGGKGGDAEATEGTGGTATNPGQDGTKTNPGGDGGDGGDGCPPGDGGPGGSGDPPGDPGDPGLNNCHDLSQAIDVSIGDDAQVVYLDELATFTSTINNPYNIASYQWYVGDFSAGDDPTLLYLFSATGIYTLRLDVTDVNGNMGSATAQVTVTARPAESFFDVFFEIVDINTFSPLSQYPAPGQAHIIVASDGTPDIRTFLPIDLTMTVDGSPFWNTTIPNDPTMVCRDATGCSIDGPVIETEIVSLNLQGQSSLGDVLVELNQ